MASANATSGLQQGLQGLQLQPSQPEIYQMCLTVAVLAGSGEYIAWIAIKLFCGIFGAFVNALQLWRRGTAWTGHDNTRVALGYVYAWNILFGLAVGSFYAYDIARLVAADCHLFDYRIVLAVRGFSLSAVFIKALIMLTIACERCYASAWPGHYEAHMRHPYITHAYCMILSLISTSTVYVIVSERFRQFVPKPVPTFDLKTSENKEEYTGLIWSIAGVQGFSIVVCAVDAIWSYRLSKRDWSMANSLNGKVQLASNLRVLKVVLPVETLDAGLCLVGTVMQIVSLLSFQSQSVFARHLYLTKHTFAVYTLFFLPIGVEIREYFIRRENRRKIVSVAPAQTNQTVTELYFAGLARAWDEISPRSANGSRGSRASSTRSIAPQMPIFVVSDRVSSV